MLKSQFRARGDLAVRVVRADGGVEVHTSRNLIVAAGAAFIATRLIGNTPGPITHMAVGEGTSAAAPGNTALQSEITGGRIAASGSTNAGVATFAATFGPGIGTGAITEAGLFNSATAGTMLCRTVFPVINKGAGDTVTINWTVTITPA